MFTPICVLILTIDDMVPLVIMGKSRRGRGRESSSEELTLGLSPELMKEEVVGDSDGVNPRVKETASAKGERRQDSAPVVTEGGRRQVSKSPAVACSESRLLTAMGVFMGL